MKNTIIVCGTILVIFSLHSYFKFSESSKRAECASLVVQLRAGQTLSEENIEWARELGFNMPTIQPTEKHPPLPQDPNTQPSAQVVQKSSKYKVPDYLQDIVKNTHSKSLAEELFGPSAKLQTDPVLTVPNYLRNMVESDFGQRWPNAIYRMCLTQHGMKPEDLYPYRP